MFKAPARRGIENISIDYQKKVLRCEHCNKFLSPSKLLDGQFTKVKETKCCLRCYHCDQKIGVGDKQTRKEHLYWVAWIKDKCRNKSKRTIVRPRGGFSKK